jgi:hypothetical protein
MSEADSVFSGISTFGRITYHPCLVSKDVKYDIAFIGKRTNPKFWQSGIADVNQVPPLIRVN